MNADDVGKKGEAETQLYMLLSLCLLHKPQQGSMFCGKWSTYRCNGFVLLPGAQGFSDPHDGKLLC